MSVVDFRVRLVENLDKQIQKELTELKLPQEYIDLEKKLLTGRDETFGIEAPVSANEEPVHRNLWVNIGYRERELRRAMGMVLLFSNIDPINPYHLMAEERDNKSEYSEHFWASYGDFQIRSCSLLDSVGAYLAFAFFGLVDAPFYFNQVINSIKLKYIHGKRIVLSGEPFKVTDKDSWDVLFKASQRYSKIRVWRDEVIHAFSPLMYMREDEGDFDEEKRKITRSPTLSADKALKNCKETYYLLKIVPLAADDLAFSFIESDSYHRNFSY